MLTPGNTKLGRGRRIWSFGLPSRRTCPGRSAACSAACYSARLEAWRPSVRRRYRRNLALSRRPDFVRRLCSFIVARRVGVVRVHVGGDFYSAGYARKWLAVMRRCRGTRFFLYTRSWRVRPIRAVLRRMARLGHVRVWFSCDRDTGVPARRPRGVRLAWLMARPGDLPPRADLVFRTVPLRSAVQKYVPLPAGRGRALVCPAENGVTRTTCERCGVCWRPTVPPARPLLSLPLLPP